jgi:hypothetical protein
MTLIYIYNFQFFFVIFFLVWFLFCLMHFFFFKQHKLVKVFFFD